MRLLAILLCSFPVMAHELPEGVDAFCPAEGKTCVIDRDALHKLIRARTPLVCLRDA
jgi:hypothetical protein